MLINLSNHPINQWSQKQIDLARKLYDEIKDLPFPQIQPDWDEISVVKLAQDYSKKIVSIIGENNTRNAVHIMGELTFTFTMVNILHKKNIECVASTTNRKVKIGEKGEKISEFNFVKFRKYPKTTEE